MTENLVRPLLPLLLLLMMMMVVVSSLDCHDNEICC